MLSAKKPTVASDTPNWVPIVAAVAVVVLIGGSIIPTAAFVKVMAGALAAVMAYLAVSFARHAIAMICDVFGGLGSIFQSWR